MSAPQQRRALPAVAFIAALTVLTAIVWVRVIDRGTDAGAKDASTCTTPAAPKPSVLPQTKAVSVIVLNASDRDNLAANTKKKLQAKGFKVTQAANDEPSYGGHGVLSGVGEIRYGPAAGSGAVLLHYYLPGATMVPTDSSTPTVILALGKKFDHVRGVDAVNTQLTGKKITRTATLPALPAAPTPSC